MEEPRELQRCRHQFLERIFARNFDKREPYPIFLFWCKLCGRTMAKQILEVETTSGLRMKEVRCVLPYEFQPWRKVIDMDKETAQKIVENRSFAEFSSYIHKTVMEENKNGRNPDGTGGQ